MLGLSIITWFQDLGDYLTGKLFNYTVSLMPISEHRMTQYVIMTKHGKLAVGAYGHGISLTQIIEQCRIDGVEYLGEL
jgi:hypothetical protein